MNNPTTLADFYANPTEWLNPTSNPNVWSSRHLVTYGRHGGVQSICLVVNGELLGNLGVVYRSLSAHDMPHVAKINLGAGRYKRREFRTRAEAIAAFAGLPAAQLIPEPHTTREHLLGALTTFNATI